MYFLLLLACAGGEDPTPWVSGCLDHADCSERGREWCLNPGEFGVCSECAHDDQCPSSLRCEFGDTGSWGGAYCNV